MRPCLGGRAFKRCTQSLSVCPSVRPSRVSDFLVAGKRRLLI